MEDARSLGLQEEFQNGIYSCCQIVAWADEQWLAWGEAAEADGLTADEVTKRLEPVEEEMVLVPVRIRRSQEPRTMNGPSDLR